MGDLERLKAQQEARDTAATRNSAERARLWAGMNRYLSAEARRAHRAAEQQRLAEQKHTEPDSD